MLDILGFRGIWRRHDAQDVLGLLRGIVRSAEGFRDFPNTGSPAPAKRVSGVSLRFLSDSVWIAKEYSDDLPSKMCALNMVIASVRVVLLDGMVSDIPLAYRGVITTGEFAFDKTFVIGRAIDEAAELESAADGAIVWLSASASQIVAKAVKLKVKQIDPQRDLPDRTKAKTCLSLLKSNLQRFAVPYSVPMKGHGTVEAYVVNPFDRDDEESRTLANNLLTSFPTSPLGVMVKRQHTKAYLDATRKKAQR